MKTEELVGALALDSILSQKLSAAVWMAAAVGTGLAEMLLFVTMDSAQRLKGSSEFYRWQKGVSLQEAASRAPVSSLRKL